MTNQSLALYYYEECPYCQRVLAYLQDHPIQIEKRNIRQTPTHRETLIKIGGKSQVPALQIGDRIMYESLDIIEWLKQNEVRS